MFFEKVFYRPVGELTGSTYAMRMAEGRFLGYHDRTGSVLCMTDKGVKRGKSLNRQPADDAWSMPDWDKLHGTPWNMIVKEPLEKPVAAGRDRAGPEIPRTPTVRQEETEPRRRYVLTADIERLGFTLDCRACDNIREKGKPGAGIAHSQDCRERIGELLERELVGKARMDAYRRRTSEKRVEAPSTPAAASAAGAAPRAAAEGEPQARRVRFAEPSTDLGPEVRMGAGD